VTHKSAPPETEAQRACRQFWTGRLGAASVGWGRDKDGRFLAAFARDAEAAWMAASSTTPGSGAGVPLVYGEPPSSIDGPAQPMSPEQCAQWLDAKFARHRELEDRACAQMIRGLHAALEAALAQPAQQGERDNT
jgi:hypothetical protein